MFTFFWNIYANCAPNQDRLQSCKERKTDRQRQKEREMFWSKVQPFKMWRKILFVEAGLCYSASSWNRNQHLATPANTHLSGLTWITHSRTSARAHLHKLHEAGSHSDREAQVLTCLKTSRPGIDSVPKPDWRASALVGMKGFLGFMAML